MDLVIVGDSAFGEVAFELFKHDSDYEPRAFAVHRSMRTRDELFGVPVVDLETLTDHFDPKQTAFYAAIVYSQLNRLRTRLYLEVKQLGLVPATYISSRATVWRNVEVGEHTFIFEDNTVQPFARIGTNTVLWSGNHIGHHTVVGNNCFIASQAVISGKCRIGNNCFVGVNATVANDVTIGDDCWIGLGVTIARDVPSDTLYKGPRDQPADKTAREQFGVDE